LGSLIGLFTGSINNAFVPISNERLSRRQDDSGVAALGTYMLFAIIFVGLCVAMLGTEIILILTPASYHGATKVVPWIALAFVFHGTYVVWSRGTWYSRRTGMVPLLTGAAAALSVLLNLWLVPRYGIRAAAINMAISYASLALMHGYLASKCYSIPWEYGRWTKMFALAIGWFFVAGVISTYSLALNVTLKATIVCVLFPLSLALARFFTSHELRLITWFSGKLLKSAAGS
jgi:O-antigen/teichoic acid export membrane protein